MKKNVWMCMLAVCGIIFLQGCGKTTGQNTPETEEREKAEVEAEDTEVVYIPVETADTETVYAEDTDDRALAEFLISYYQVPEEEWMNTRYYYNYIDLNADGIEEIFVVVVGEYTETSGGDPALILEKEGADYKVLEDFPFVRTPIYVSEQEQDGWADLVMPCHGRGEETGYQVYHYIEQQGYQNDAEEFLEEFDENFCGKKILANNFIDDMDKGNYLTLAGWQEK